MSQLTQQQRDDFVTKHIPHRWTLLATFEERQRWFKEELDKGNQHGDLARCSKDTALISIRLFTEALGLHVTKSGRLMDSRRKEFANYREGQRGQNADNVWVDDLGGELATPDDLTESEIKLLIGMNNRADKELAHLTSTFDGTFNTAKNFVQATQLLRCLLKKCLYDKLGKSFPSVDKGISLDPAFFADVH